MSRTSAPYGRRGRLSAANTGIRQTASTYGNARFGTYSEKAGGHINVESDADRFVPQLLTIDPRDRAFQPQPFGVDLIDQRMLFTRGPVRGAWHKHRDVPGAKFSVRALCSDLELSPGLVPVLLVNGVLTGDLAHHTTCGTLELSLAHGDQGHLCLLEGVEA